MEINQGIKHIVCYSIAIATLVFGLKWLQWKYLIVDNAVDLYIGLMAIVFTTLGAWIASQIIKPKTKTVFVEKQILIEQPKAFILNEAELNRLSLTNREYQILKLIAQGNSYSDIATHLFLSLSTIKTHVSNLYTKMKVKNRVQAITLARKMEIVE